TPTTLSGAASETYNGEVPRKSKAPLFAAIGGVVALAGVIGVVALGGGKKDAGVSGSQVPAEQKTTPVESKVEFITVTVNSDPPGSKVTRGDISDSGTTPWQMKVKKGDPQFDVLVKNDGYTSTTRAITTDKSYSVLIPLVKNPV